MRLDFYQALKFSYLRGFCCCFILVERKFETVGLRFFFSFVIMRCKWGSEEIVRDLILKNFVILGMFWSLVDVEIGVINEITKALKNSCWCIEQHTKEKFNFYVWRQYKARFDWQYSKVFYCNLIYLFVSIQLVRCIDILLRKKLNAM